MEKKPLLFFPEPQKQKRPQGHFGPTKYHFPHPKQQNKRLSPQFLQLQKSFKSKSLELRTDPMGTAPEQVLVLEIVGSIDKFMSAVQNIEGMEWLGEWEEEDLPSDEDFYDESNKEKTLNGRLFLTMANERAMNELLSLWKTYNKDPQLSFQRGLAKWKKLFQQLREIRPWDIKERFYETGVVEDWNERLKSKKDKIRFEIELWFRYDNRNQEECEKRVLSLIKEENGTLITKAMIPDIKYHALLAELPVAAVQKILSKPDNIRLIKCDQIMFFRPIGQALIPSPEENTLAGTEPAKNLRKPHDVPIVALFDGMPLQNHKWLDGRLIVDDPDNWEGDCPAAERLHGTSMASLIIHDELDAQDSPLDRPVYTRPILKPDINDWRARPRVEMIPDNVLPVDLLHRAVKRMFDGEAGQQAVAPSIHIINLSVGDISRPFYRFLSPWARIVDWLAWNYKVLIVVSAGNHDQDIELDIPPSQLQTLTPDNLQEQTLNAIFNDARNRRILSPAETINALTAGAVHNDFSQPGTLPNTVINPFISTSLPSPVNSIGLGFRRAVKPDILYRGGRQIYAEKLGNIHPNATLQIRNFNTAPGQKTAAPGSLPGDLTAIRYCRGTSNATALTSRTAAHLFEIISQHILDTGRSPLERDYIVVLIKALIAHSASWNQIDSILADIVRANSNSRKFKENMNRFVGYGPIEPDKLHYCTSERATLLGFGKISKDDSHIYSMPLPPSLSGKAIWRRLTITLAWLSPINPSHRNYRKAALFFQPLSDDLKVNRSESDFNTMKRGTLQHDIMEGTRASAYIDGSNLIVSVNCREDASNLAEEIPYGLITTLEVAESVDIPVYEEIRARIRQVVTVSPTSGRV